MSDLTLKQIFIKKHQLGIEIRKLLHNFSFETGIDVSVEADAYITTEDEKARIDEINSKYMTNKEVEARDDLIVRSKIDILISFPEKE